MVPIPNDFWYKSTDKEHKTPHPNKNCICLHCQEEGHIWQSEDKPQRGGTSNLWGHLKLLHQIYQAGQEPSNSDTRSQTTLDENGFMSRKGPPPPEMMLEQAIIEWMVDTQQPFDTVEGEKWKQIWNIALNRKLYPIRTQQVARSRIEDEYNRSQYLIYGELDLTAETVSFSLDVWKVPNGKYIFTIIVHWTMEDFEDRQVVLHFGHLPGSHTGENLARETYKVLNYFNLREKLVAITGDNASNNPSLCRHLYKLLSKDFTDDPNLGNTIFEDWKLMQFKGNESFVRCMAHILNLVAKAILKELKAGSHKEARKLIWEMAEKKVDCFKPEDTPKSAIGHLRLIVLWLLASEQHMIKFGEYADIGLDYDVDTRWNAFLKMLELCIRSRVAIDKICDHFPTLASLCLSPAEWSFIGEIH